MTAPPRSYLYVPGDRPEMLAKADARGADALILDLEDAVASARKAEARRLVGDWLHDRPADGPETWVRVNADPAALGDDLRVARTGPVTGVVVPKVDGPARLDRIGEALAPGQGIIALIETGAGVLQAPAIASAGRVRRLALGEADLAADLGIAPTAARALDPLRVQIVVASAAAGLEGPVAPVSTDLRDLASFERSTRELMDLGFTGRSAVHPDQVPVINRVFTPTDAEVAAARAMVDAADRARDAGSGVFLDAHGRVVDEAVVRSARRVLHRAGLSGPGSA